MTDDLERFKGILATIAMQNPYMSVKDALLTAVEVEQAMLSDPEFVTALDLIGDPEVAPPEGCSVETLGRWAMRQKSVMDFVPGKKIHAIRELRILSHAGLREAKEAVEWAESHSRKTP